MSRNSKEGMTALSQQLHKNMTKEEKKLWYGFLKHIPFTVNRQKTMDDYIVDFYCAELKLVIELDGEQHYSEEGRKKDALRDEHLRLSGNTVVRFTNHEVKTNYEGVCVEIMRVIKELTGRDDIVFPCPK